MGTTFDKGFIDGKIEDIFETHSLVVEVKI